MEEGFEEEVERRDEERTLKQPNTSAHAWMTWNDTQASLEPQVRRMNTCASTDGAQRAQNYAVFTSVFIVVFMQLLTMCSRLLKLCVKMYAVFRSLLYHKMFVNIRCRMYCIYTPRR